MDKLKSFAVKFVVLLINAVIVAGGVFFIKNQSEKNNEEQPIDANASGQETVSSIDAAAKIPVAVPEVNLPENIAADDDSQNTTVDAQTSTPTNVSTPEPVKTVAPAVTTPTPKKKTKTS